MAAIPMRSQGVLVAALGDEAVVYDLLTETLHRLNHSAGLLLDACDGRRSLDTLIAQWAAQASIDTATVTRDTTAALAHFAELGLVDRTTEPLTPPVAAGSAAQPTPGSITGGAHPVIDHRVAVRSTNPELVSAADDRLGTTVEEPPTIIVDLIDEPTGDIVLIATEALRFPNLPALLEHLSVTVTQYAVQTTGCVVLHAGGVRSPAGELIVLPAPSGSGKSTLTAAFVASGWDYLSDEAVGIRPESLTAVGYPKPLSLQPSACAAAGIAHLAGGNTDGDNDMFLSARSLRAEARLLGGDVGAVDRIVFPTFVPHADTSVETLTPSDAFVELLANTLNLAWCGEVGLRTLCRLATAVPAFRIRHDDATAAVDILGALG